MYILAGDIADQVQTKLDAVRAVHSPQAAVFDLDVYPNPAGDFFRLNNGQEVEAVQLVNARGQIMREQTLLPGENEISVAGLDPGYYFIRAFTSSGQRLVKSLAVAH